MTRIILIAIAGILGIAVQRIAIARADTSAKPQATLTVDFARDIRPILSNHCFKCHGPAKQEAGIRLDLREGALKRKTIVPGKPEASRMIRKVLADEEERMPPADAGPRLKPEQIARLKAWIAQGAEFSPHWAYVKPRERPLPSVKDRSWTRNPIDRFIAAGLERAGLKPSSEAERPTLIRRLSLDLLGVLPEPREVDAYVKDARPDAYERLVERLLSSPHYGERQGRHWLDLARYADSNGYTIDGERSIWPWRDWVIGAFNRNLPFDRFTIEQLAGDLLPSPTTEQLVATGFHRNTSFNEEGGTNPEQFRVERTVDRTNTTGTVWLGLTVGCAQCHDHKYDTISTKEYYQLYAFLNSADEPRILLPTEQQKLRLDRLRGELRDARAEAAKRKKSPKDLEKILASLEKDTHGGWKLIYPKNAKSDQGATLDALEDRSVLASGKVGASDTYTVHGVAPETGAVSAIRLEALTHPSLPKKGPGRASNGNFVLSDFNFDTDGGPPKLGRAIADHSQAGYDVNDVLLGEPNKGWAVNSDKPAERNVDRQAVFILKRPRDVREGQTFVFTLRFSELPKGYALGRFRIAVTYAAPRFLDLPLSAQNIILMDRARRSPKDMASLERVLFEVPAETAKIKKLDKEIKALEATVATTLILRERSQPRKTHIQKRGDFLTLGAEVQPAGFAALPPVMKQGKQPTRLDLARWLVSADNPLTPRVVVNRIWQQYFGKGLVETENDFGIQGTLPTHPELLDWLALEFVRQGWDMKAMHRLIVTSATYRQSSALRKDLTERDPNNRLLGRQERLRLEAEIIRDAALTASGLLTRKLGGPGVYPPQPPEIFSFTQNARPWPESKGPDRYRRGMYTFLWRQCQHPLMTTFDGPDAQVACTRRNRSNTPLQALHLANDPTFVEIAEGLAKRIVHDGPGDDAGRVRHGFRLCFARTPSAAEESRLVEYVSQARQVGGDRAWFLLARALLNLDEFITRE
ncbi:MAG: DUF1553 domain-containing protein [Planctomycetes bacterium]|nr:DUF1553 domain-containing protein [Planctomycetota bacterium]